MTAPRAPTNRAEVVAILQSAFINAPAVRGMGDFALAALEAAGVRLVPAEETDRDLEDCCVGTGLLIADVREMRRRFLAASPYAPEGGR